MKYKIPFFGQFLPSFKILDIILLFSDKVRTYFNLILLFSLSLIGVFSDLTKAKHVFSALVGPNQVVRTKVSTAVLYCITPELVVIWLIWWDGVFRTTGYFNNQLLL